MTTIPMHAAQRETVKATVRPNHAITRKNAMIPIPIKKFFPRLGFGFFVRKAVLQIYCTIKTEKAIIRAKDTRLLTGTEI